MRGQAHTEDTFGLARAGPCSSRREGGKGGGNKAVLSFPLDIRVVSWSRSARLRVVIVGERKTGAGFGPRKRVEGLEEEGGWPVRVAPHGLELAVGGKLRGGVSSAQKRSQGCPRVSMFASTKTAHHDVKKNNVSYSTAYKVNLVAARVSRVLGNIFIWI